MSLHQKSPEAFRTISEVAAELDVPQHVLRFWESKFTQIKPLKRGGGRRYYRPEDVDLLRGVRALLYNDGYTIKGVQKVFREQGGRFAAEAGRGTVDGTIAELAREAVERQNGADEDVAEEANDNSPLSVKARKELEAIALRLEKLRDALEEARVPEAETESY